MTTTEIRRHTSRREHATAERHPIASLRTFKRSLQSVYRAHLVPPPVSRAALRAFRHRMRTRHAGSPEPVLLLGGLGTLPSSYRPCARLLRTLGHEVHLERNVDGTFAERVAALTARVEKIAGAAQRPVRIVGHSLGGLLGVALLDARPDLVAQVIAVASPLSGGTPCAALQRLALRALRLERAHRDALRRRLPRRAARVTTIAAAHDPIAPPQACRLAGASNHVVDQLDPADASFATHAGLVYLPAILALVLAALAEPIGDAAPLRDVG